MITFIILIQKYYTPSFQYKNQLLAPFIILPISINQIDRNNRIRQRDSKQQKEMTKKQWQATTNAGLKKGKIKRKQMFNELQTPQQQQIEEQDNINQSDYQIKMDQEPQNYKVQSISLTKEKSLDEVCHLVNQLMAKNKINTKNAFDVPIIDLYDLINFNPNQQDDAENTWKTLSSTLQNDYKIWGYRVDAIHSITYSILNIINRRTVDTQEKLKPQLEKNKQQSGVISQFDDLKQSFLSLQQSQKTFLEYDSSNQLQYYADKLNISLVQCGMTSDPTLQRTKRLFDEPGLKGMLTNSISISNNLELSLFSKPNQQTYSMKLTELASFEVKPVQHPLKVFDSIDKIRSDINSILNGNTTQITNKELQQIWKNIKKGSLGDWADPNQRVWLDVQDPQCPQQFDMMIDQNSQHHHLFQGAISNKRLIGDFIKMKNLQSKSKKIMTDQEMMVDSERWLNEIDRKFLGIKSTSNAIQKPITINNTSKASGKPLDDVDFTFSVGQGLLQVDETLKKQSLGKQFTQFIEDKFLMTIRPSVEFRIQKILTLRQEPEISLLSMDEQMMVLQDHDHFLQKQIDVKRQMSSIKEIKENLYEDINGVRYKQKTSFLEVYNNYSKNQNEISPALCFLTLLHLANEKNLSFEALPNQLDFIIKIPTK